MTIKIRLTDTPIQITNGAQSAFIQLQSSHGANYFNWAVSDTLPANTAICHASKELSINPPFKVWAWANSNDQIDIIVSAVTA